MALKKFAVVTSVGLHLRADATKASAWLDKLGKGDRVEVLDTRAGWLFVCVERTGQRGWVYSAFVQLDLQPEPPPAPTFEIVRVRFSTGPGLVSKMISQHTYGFWASHADAILADGRKLGAEGDGVKVRAANYDDGYLTKELVLELKMPSADAKRFHDFLEAQIGKPYDFSAVAAFAVARDWQRADAWFCSELIAAALLECGYLRPLAASTNKITPRDLLLILSGKVGTGAIAVKET